MKILNLMGNDMKVIKFFNKAICKDGDSVSSTVPPYDTIEIDSNQVVYDFNVLESLSVVFKLNLDDEHYYVTMFGSMYSQENGQDCDDDIVPMTSFDDIMTFDIGKLKAHRDKRKRDLGLIDKDEFGYDKLYDDL